MAKKIIDRALSSPLEKSLRPTSTAGQSNRSDLAQRLGIKPGVPINFRGDAGFLLALLGDTADSFSTIKHASRPACLCLAVTHSAADVEALFEASSTFADGTSIWIIHPKQSGRYATDFNQNDVRTIGLSRGWVDNKVCSVDSDWSGLKFARRKPGEALQPRSMKYAVKRSRS